MCCNVDNNVLFSHVAMCVRVCVCVCVFILSLHTLLVQINERFIAHMVAEYYFYVVAFFFL